MHLKKWLGIVVCLFCLFVFLAAADESSFEDQLHSVTKHSVTIGGQAVDYTGTDRDAACDHFTAQYTMSHLDLSGKLKDRISFGFYESGHMMYIHLPHFILSACPEK